MVRNSDANTHSDGHSNPAARSDANAGREWCDTSVNEAYGGRCGSNCGGGRRAHEEGYTRLHSGICNRWTACNRLCGDAAAQVRRSSTSTKKHPSTNGLDG